MFFRDACGLLAERPLCPSVTHLVAHLLREVESAVRSVLEPPNAAAGAKTDKHRARIEAVLKELGIHLDDPAAESWLGLAGDDNPDSLARRAHRSALDAPRPPDQVFLDLFARVELVLDAVLERFETRYFEVFERLDALLGTVTPTKEKAKSLRNNFPASYAVSNYFFSRATAAWIGPLKAEGFFRSPPPPQLDEDRGTVQLPPWPESQFLARVASHAPAEVVDVAVSLPTTENARVNYDMIKVALGCPPEIAAKLVPKIVDGIGSRFGVLIPHEAGALLVALSEGQRVDEALALARALIDHAPSGYGPTSSVDAYEYGMILREHIPSVVRIGGVQALAMLDRALAGVVRADSDRSGGAPGRDSSYIWRPNVDSSGGRADSDVRHALINAVRDAATTLASAEQGKVAEIVAELETHDSTIFRRLALWLLAQYADHNQELTTARIINPVVVADRHVEREYLLLARAGAGVLDAGQLRRLLRIIDAGPQPSTAGTVSNRAIAQVSEADSESRARMARWQRDRFAALAAVLPPEWDARYQELVTEYGAAPDPTEALPEPFAVWRGEDSPVSASDLAAMPTAVLVDFLKTWQPPTDRWGSPSPASLRAAVGSAVQDDAERRSADLELFIGLPAVYIGAVINGIYQARTNDAVLDWNGIVGLCTWINQQAAQELANLDAEPNNREWREPRLEMLRLLMVGLNQEPNPVPTELDERIWAIIVDSCADPDPDIRREANATDEGFGGFIGLALNVTRPQAVRAAISYGLRLRRRTPDADLSTVLALLNEHLDPISDPSRSVRSIYGELFPQLVWMSPEWAAAHVESIFPTAANQNELLGAAWDGYLGGGRITDATWNLLRDRYGFMIDRLDTANDDDRLEDSRAAQIGGHLLNALWLGRMGLDTHDGLLRRYYSKIGPKIAAHLMWRLSQSLDSTAPPDPQVLDRLRSLWEYRVSMVESGADAGELTEFGRWFASGLFDPKWSFAQLLTVLTLAQDVKAETAALAKAAELADDHLQPCLAVLERWASLENRPWRLTQGIESIRAILRLGVKGNPTAVETSKKVISIFLARDHGIDLRDVLRDAEDDQGGS